MAALLSDIPQLPPRFRSHVGWERQWLHYLWGTVNSPGRLVTVFFLLFRVGCHPGPLFNTKQIEPKTSKWPAQPFGCGISRGENWNLVSPELKSGSGRSLGEGNGSPLQRSCLENPMDREPGYIVHRVAKSRTRLKQLSTHPWQPTCLFA